MIGHPHAAARLLSHEGNRTGAPRFLPMIGDSMAPTLRTGDFAAIAPVSAYTGPGIYAFEEFGSPVLKRAEHIAGTRQIRLSYDNPAYSPFVATVEQFESNVIGKAFALCSICDTGFIFDALAARGENRA